MNDFEKSMERLEEISKKMSDENITLDSSLKLYKEAETLITFCKKEIEDAKLSLSVYGE
ncbi:hypothetical protein FACS189499_01490 [Clostridia bacterium]|nr:hypothetical protein FACS189499_01490 [Clostridia bacterium]